MAQEAREVHYRGRVQGVGFRYTTREVAARFAVTGYVRNLPDGRVHLLAEGEPAELQRFLAAVSEAMAGNIDDAEVQVRTASGALQSFEIRL